MARTRLQAAARKLAATMELERRDEADVVADGVRAVAREIASQVEPGSLYWRAPFQYTVEQMAPRIVAEHKLPEEAIDTVAAYVLAAFNEYVIALVGEFDQEHFAAWSAAMIAAEQHRSTTTDD